MLRFTGFGMGVGTAAVVALFATLDSGASLSAQRRLARSERVPTARILYSSDWSGTRQIYSVDPGRPKAVAQLTFGHERSCDPLVVACGLSDVVPSPDGRHIAFTSFGDYTSGSLYVSRTDGRGRRRVVQLDGFCDPEIAWAPDTSKLAFASNCPSSSAVYIAKADGSGVRLLNYGRDPSWSRDGRSLALISTGELLRFNEGRFREIANDVGSYAWSPTGKQLAIATYDPEDHLRFTRVATVRPDGSGVRQLDVGATVDGFGWSPSGRWLALTTYKNGLGELDLVRPDGSQRRSFTDRSVFGDWAWSSDGRYISYDGYSGLTVLDLAAGSATQLGDHAYGSGRWSRKGHLLAFANDPGISVFDPKSLTTRTLSSGYTDGSIAWAPDDRSIAYEGHGVRLVSLAGQVRTVVAGSGTAGGSIDSMSWIRPTGRLQYRKPQPRIVAKVAAGQLTALWPIGHLAADGDRVLYETCGHLFVWTPTTGGVVQADEASLTPECSTPGHYRAFNVYDVALAGNRIAFGVQSGNMSQGWVLVQQTLADPATQQQIARDFGYAGCTLGDAGLGDLVGSGDLLVFSRWSEAVPDSLATCGIPTTQQIYRLDAAGCPCPQVASSPGLLLPTDVDSGRLVAVGSNKTEVLNRNGTELLAVPVQALSAQLSGSDLVVVTPGQLRDYDAADGALLHAWPLPDVPAGGPCGSPHPWACRSIRLELEDAAHGLAAYVLDGDLHVVRLDQGTDRTIGKATTARFMNAGLVYAEGARINFIPYSQLGV
jgi:Tol biopolymer transport system component